ncbi:FecR domain-containing protein [bacterium SCSIO 12827]|nr:FecR domain-containing protein [bacterium SCSIO 12827]
MTTPADTDQAELEAAEWLIVLAERPDDADLRRRFETWLGANDLNAEIWARTRRAYDFAGRGAARTADQWIAPAAAEFPHSRHIARKKTAIAAVGLALAACLAIAVVPDVLLRIQADQVTATGETGAMRLADGSHLRLGPESAVAVDFSPGARRVKLIKGRAFFEVQPDPDRPFRVSAGKTTATVLGTAFGVSMASGGARVAVSEGRVRVEDASTAPPTHVDLTPGDWLDVTWNGGTRHGRAHVDEIAAWRGGEVVARDRPAGEVVDALRPYFRGAIVVQSGRFAERRVSGIYNLTDPAATLGGLASSHGAVMRRVSPWLLVVTDW